MNKGNQRGITLIALIITIIVMLILVAVVVQIAVNSGLFDHAKDGTQKWADEQNKEAEISTGEYIDNIIDDYNTGYFNYEIDKETKTATITGIKEEYSEWGYYHSNRGENLGKPLWGYPICIRDGEKEITDLIIPSEVSIKGEIYSVTSIGDNAFGCGYWYYTGESHIDAMKWTSISIPDTVIEIGDFAFSGSSSLSEIVIPDSVRYIGRGAFYRSGMELVTLLEGIQEIGEDAFYHCSSLTSINIPGSVTSIGIYAFSSCSSLTSINIPDGVTSIGYNAFEYWTATQTINCQATEKPDGWDEGWDYYNYSTPCKATVNWGVSM